MNWRVSSRVRAISLKVQTLKVRKNTKTRNEIYYGSATNRNESVTTTKIMKLRKITKTNTKIQINR